MKVAVTGGSGKLGRAVVTDLLSYGYEVIVLDMTPPRDAHIPFTKVDLSDFGQTLEAFLSIDSRHSGLDAIVHLAAIPAPGQHTNAHTYLNNTACTFNVFQAAKHAGIKNIVWASSETLLGIPFDVPPPYVPLDEDYAARPETSYSLSKLVDETIAQEFCRMDPALKIVGLRFSNVMEPHDYTDFPGFDDDPTLRKWNLWAYIDARDGAQAVRKSLEYRKKGLEIFIIANSDTVMSRPNAELMAAVFPDVPFKRPVGPNESLLSIDKARRLLGYEPTFNWSQTQS